MADQCTTRSGEAAFTATEIDENGEPVKIPFDASLSTPWCPNGWTPPPHAGSMIAPMPPPDVPCDSLPCLFNESEYVLGGTWLFDVVADPFEHNNVAAEHPDVVKDLLSRLQKYNASAIAPQKGLKDDSADPSNFGGVWTPWRGNPDPAVCDTNKIHGIFRSSIDTRFKIQNVSGKLSMAIAGWAWNSSFADGGLSPVAIQISVDGKTPVVSNLVADVTRPGVLGTGAPNAEHGFNYLVSGAAAEALLSEGSHSLHVRASSYPATSELNQAWTDLQKSPVFFKDGAPRAEELII